jgi:hypothetical protein
VSLLLRRASQLHVSAEGLVQHHQERLQSIVAEAATACEAELREGYPATWEQVVRRYKPVEIEEVILRRCSNQLHNHTKVCLNLAAKLSSLSPAIDHSSRLQAAAQDANSFVASAAVLNILLRKVRPLFQRMTALAQILSIVASIVSIALTMDRWIVAARRCAAQVMQARPAYGPWRHRWLNIENTPRNC